MKKILSLLALLLLPMLASGQNYLYYKATSGGSASAVAPGATATGCTVNSVVRIAAGPVIECGGALSYSTALATLTASSANFNINATAGLTLQSGGTSRLSVDGTGLFFSNITTASGTPGSICYNTATNEVTRNSALTCTVSSARFKDSIERYDASALSIIDSITPATFTYKDHPERPRLGLIAEDLAAVDIRLAERGEDGSPNSIDFPAVMAVLIKAVQELKAEVATLKAAK